VEVLTAAAVLLWPPEREGHRLVEEACCLLPLAVVLWILRAAAEVTDDVN
jgi:hypothetical protein